MRNKEAQSKYGLLCLWQKEGIMMKTSWSIKFCRQPASRLTMNVSASPASMQWSGPYELKPARDFAYSKGAVTTFKYISLSLIE
jgi:hypothetical protein